MRLVLQWALSPTDLSADKVSSAWTDSNWSGPTARLVDTTMFYAPRSGGVKRYLHAKRAWFSDNRPGVRHTLVVPGAETRRRDSGVMTIAAVRVPFGDGYRFPASRRRWADHLESLRPDLIEAGDAYGPGHAALDAADRLGVPVVGFCHSDPAALAALHVGAWAEAPVRRRWARLLNQFDQMVAPSQHIAARLHEAGVHNVVVQPLGVDTETFHPSHADPEGLRRQLGLSAATRLLVFVGRPAREKNIEVMLDAAARLGDGYHLVLVGAGAGQTPQPNATFIDFTRDSREVARMIASCDAFIHANDREPFGLVVLEAMASGLPVVGVQSGGVSELVDPTVGELAARPEGAAMAEAVEALFARDYPAIGAAARRRVEERFGWNRTFEGLSSLYRDLTGAHTLAPVTTPKRPDALSL